MLAKIKRFVAPPHFPEDDEKTRIANLLNTLLWMFIVTFLVIAGVVVFSAGDNATTILIFVGVAAINLLPLYILRQGQVKAASWIALALYYSVMIWAIFFRSGLSVGSATALMLLVVLTGLFLGRTAATVIVVLTIAVSSHALQLQAAGQLIVPQASTISNILPFAATFILVGIALNITLRDLKNASDRMRQSNEQLLDIQVNLEQVVKNRTRDLNLAADIGRSISQIRELDVLLQRAVNTIREQFGLYYVQIYLADNKQRFLSLKSGTGMVGQQLVRRGHSLPFGGGSINGMAAADKRVVLVADTAASPIFKPNSLLPYTRSEMAVPLVTGDKIVGVLNLQSDQPKGLSEDNLAAFETLAGQFAIAIENANLFAETAAARAEVEVYLQRVTREGWDNYQDAITRPAAVGMVYEAGTTRPLSEMGPFDAGANGLQVPITIANELVGSIQLEADAGHQWSEEEKELISTIAWQVGQQAESLRLLTETERYRAEAEQAARRLSGEAWREFLQEKRGQENRGFIYTDEKVIPLTEESLPDDADAASVRQPLKIHNESVGELFVAGGNQAEAQVLLTSVSNQLSRHIENIRLVEQTESALGQTESLYQIGHELNTATNVNEILHAALGPIFPTGIDEATLMFIELDKQSQPQTLELLAGWRMDGSLSFPVGTIFPMQRFPFTSLFINEPDDPQLIGDAATDSRVDDFTRGVMAHAGIKAIAVIPLTMGGQWVGIITCSWPQPRTFSRQEEEIFNALINMAAPAVQSQRLFHKTKSQADKEHLINAINQRIQNTVSVESALQTAVKELGQALQTKTLVKLNMGAAKQPDNYKEAEAVSAD